jgi:amino acid transporter
MGWNYAVGWLVILPFELTAASITIGYWDPDQKYSLAIWISIFLVFVVVINFFGVRGYGEVEFILGMMKVLAIIGFILFAIILNTGGIKSDGRGYIGFRYWAAPYSAFKNGFHGFCSVFVTASFAFGGTELVGLGAAEADNPAKTLPKATKQVFWRITLFYVISLLMVGLVVPGNDPILAKASGANSSASPFVLAISNAGIKGLPSVFNAVIMMSVISVANSCTYGSTRTLQAMALRGMAPRIFAKIDSKGRPWTAMLLALGLGFLAYINLAGAGSQIFNWLLALVGLANIFTWGSIMLAHICFRRAWKLQGRQLEEIPFQAQFGITGSYIGFAIACLVLIAQFYIALFVSLYPDPSECPKADFTF